MRDLLMLVRLYRCDQRTATEGTHAGSIKFIVLVAPFDAEGVLLGKRGAYEGGEANEGDVEFHVRLMCR